MRYGAAIRMIVLMAALTAMIIISGLYSQRLLRNDSEKLEKNIETMQNSIRSNEWENASDALQRISSDWKKIKKTWSALIDHEEIDNMDMTLSKLEALLEMKDASSALSEAAAFKRLVIHIPEREKLAMDNLF
jgi:predicted nuclease with TOPRIM domain